MDYKIDFIEKHDDQRGHLVVFLKNSNLGEDLKKFGQIYFVTFDKPGIIRGNHYHKKWREWFGVVTGKVEVILKDMNTGEIFETIIDSGSNKYARLEIGPNIAHSFRNLSDEASLLNYTDTEWSPDDTFPEELLKVEKSVFIHPSAIVETDKIGGGSKIWAFVHILGDVEIGEEVNICDHCFVESGVKIGNKVTIKCGVWLWDGVLVSDNVFIGPSVAFTNDLYPRSKNKDYQKKETILSEGCSIGANSTILAGVKIGKYAMVGAGSVVTKDVADFELVYGNPAVHKGYICKCGEKLLLNGEGTVCKCGLKYGTEVKII